jgi:hypothetical protein
MSIASKLKLPITEIRLICWSFVALAGRSFAAWIVVPREGRCNPAPADATLPLTTSRDDESSPQAASRSKARTAS